MMFVFALFFQLELTVHLQKGAVGTEAASSSSITQINKVGHTLIL